MHLSEKTTAANAALMGWGNTRRIVLGDTLAANFTHDETEAVLAHELGHHVHHDIWRVRCAAVAGDAGDVCGSRRCLPKRCSRSAGSVPRTTP